MFGKSSIKREGTGLQTHRRTPSPVWAGLIAGALLAFNPVAASAGTRTLTPEEIDAVAERAIQTLGVPGVSIAVIQKGQPTYINAYGVESLDTGRTATPATLFGIGSVSKAFTTTAIAVLVDQGKLAWDDPVIDHIPEFRMSDAWVTREFTIRDLVSHRSGLPAYAGDLIMVTESKATRKNVYRALANLKPATSFRTAYAYDNLMYVVAGDLIERVSGMAWEAFVETSILKPLGMDGCVADQAAIPKSARVSSPHDLNGGKLNVVKFSLPALTKPAGGIFCNPAGMAKWAEFNMGGKVGSMQLSAVQRAALQSPVTIMQPGELDAIFGKTQFASYGLGWFVQDSYGTTEVQHAGGLPGMVSQLSLFPKEGLGIVVLTNRGSSAAHAVAYQLEELAFTEEPQDAIALFEMLATRTEALKKRQTEAANSSDGSAMAKDVRPALPTSAYSGTYRDAWFGDVIVSANQAGILSIDMGSRDLSANLDHVNGDLFVARWNNRELNADAYVLFTPDTTGAISGIEMQAVSATTDHSYDFNHLDLVRMPPSRGQ